MKSNLGKPNSRSGLKGWGLDYDRAASLPQRSEGQGRVAEVLSPAISVSLRISHPGIDRIMRFMAENYHRPIQVQSLGKIAGLSKRGLFKAFQRHTGSRPAVVLRGFRIEQAQQLLRNSDLSLPEVAAQCGYRSVNSFWVSFRTVSGLTPGRYRQQMQMKFSMRGD